MEERFLETTTQELEQCMQVRNRRICPVVRAFPRIQRPDPALCHYLGTNHLKRSSVLQY